MITRTTCRVCDSAMEPVLDLGDLYVSDFISPGDPDGTKAPLELVLCRRCRLLQLRHTVPAETMYRNYWYRSGTNQTMRVALADIANKAETLIRLKEGDAVVDIGCNDGTLLASYRTGGIRKIGFDPAQNLAAFSRKIADKLVVGFFDRETFRNDPQLAGCRPEIVTSIAMFYDLEDPNRFVSDVKDVMDPEGLWIVQMSYLPLMLKTNEFGNICHEHLEYYSLTSFEYLLDRHGFEVVDVELNDINGGSIRAYIRNREADPDQFADATYRDLAPAAGPRPPRTRKPAGTGRHRDLQGVRRLGRTGSGKTWSGSSGNRWPTARRCTSTAPRPRGTPCCSTSGWTAR